MKGIKRHFLYTLSIVFILVSTVVLAQQNSSLSMHNIIPKPVMIKPAEGQFMLTKQTRVVMENNQLSQIETFLISQIKAATGLSLESAKKGGNNAIIISLQKSDTLNHKEAYTLEITEHNITLTAITLEGVYRGVQTLMQLLPPAGSESISKSYQVPTGTIYDAPSYAYRGAMLDVARHFFSVSDVKRFIDLIAMYKMNHLHLHLTDDQGWRIEIKSWPRLTEYGGSSAVEGAQGGFFSQADYREIVNYANQNYITIVPEIDMPGHTNAALASYAELNCSGEAPELYTGTEVGFSTLCTDKEVTYEFVDDVIRELSQLTPGPYIHVGGDESHETPLEDYIPFINRVQGIVKKYGKTMIGWDEVAHADLDSGVIVQFWATAENASMAIEKGAKVLMSPASRTYMDMQYHEDTQLGQDWAGLIEVDYSYDWDPEILVPDIDMQSILGVEAPLWTETITTMDDIEYMVFPRILGIAEIGWTPAGQRDWDEYKTRLAEHGYRLSALGVDFYASEKVEWAK